jgi:hypothetical protein
MKQVWIYVAFLLVNIVLCIYAYNQKCIASQFFDDYSTKALLSYDYVNSVKYNGLRLDDVYLSDRNDSVYSIKEVAKGDKVLVLRYSYIDCGSCVDSLIKQTNNLSEILGREKIVILAKYNSRIDYINFIRLNNIKNNIYNIKDSLSVADELNVPYFFVLEKNMTTSNFFIPRKEFSKLTEDYLHAIENILTE